MPETANVWSLWTTARVLPGPMSRGELESLIPEIAASFGRPVTVDEPRGGSSPSPPDGDAVRESDWVPPPRRQPGDPSYDDLQARAQLIACRGCGRSFYMTVPRDLCIECRGRSRG